MSIKLFTPDLYVKSVLDIPKDYFKDIKVIFTDADNTLSAHGSQILADGISDWLDSLKQEINIVLLSNNDRKRCEPFAQKIGVDFICNAKKPSSKKLLQKVNELGLETKDCVVIGDQFFTDLLCAKNANIKSILVDPLFKDTKRFIKIKRFFEKPLRKCLQYSKV